MGVRTGIVTGGMVLLPGNASARPGAVTWSDGTIDATPDDPPGTVSGREIDASGALVLPGVVDLHSDAFERAVMPRGGIWVDIDVALADNDSQLLAAGVTTAFPAVTDGWEPGLRSRETLRCLISAIARRRSGPDIALHVRHERCATEDIDELEAWIAEGTVRLLSFNDHTPGGIVHVGEIGAGQVQRSGVDHATLEAIRETATSRRELGMRQERELADLAEAVGCPTASHDSHDERDLRRDVELGVAIAEFPMSLGLASRYADAGISVMLGAPNLVRGGSHLANLSALDAVRAGVGDLLCSDYHYPSLLQAPFVLSAAGAADLGAAWAMVSSAPAAAARLTDRGRLAAGARADLIVVDPPGAGPASVRAVVVAGTVVYERL